MDVFNIALDDSEGDTSQDELDEDEEILKSVFTEHSRIGDQNTIDAETVIVNTSVDTPEKFDRDFVEWERPKVPDGALFYSSSGLQEQPESFRFFMIDSISSVTPIKHPGIQLNSPVKDMPLHNVMRLFGVANVENEDAMKPDDFTGLNNFPVSVCVNVHGFLPYFYILPSGKLGEDMKYWTSSKADDFIEFLNKKLQTDIMKDLSYIKYHEFVSRNQCIVDLQPLKVADVGSNIYHFHDGSSDFKRSSKIVLKVFCSLPRFVWKAKRILDQASMLFDGSTFQTFETNINNNIRFLTDRNLSGCSWLELKAGSYFRRTDSPIELQNCPMKETHCQVELDIHFQSVVKFSNQHSRTPAIRILSFDIEVMVTPEDSDFKKIPSRPVIQIGNVLGNYQGFTNTESIIGKAIFVIGTCDPIPDTKIIQFCSTEPHNPTNEDYMKDAEATMLDAWRDFVIRMDPDIIIGYNIKKFDVPYLFNRTQILGNMKSARLPFLGRIKNVKTRIREIRNCVKQGHHYDVNNVSIQGRVIIDLYPILMRHDRQGSGQGYFKLCNVAERLLGNEEKKQDVNYKEIEGLQKGDSATRQKLAKYCLQDSKIPFLILYKPMPSRIDKIGIIDFYFEKSQSGGNLVRYIFNKSKAYNEYFNQVRMHKIIDNKAGQKQGPSS